MHGRLADPDCTIGTDPRADPRMVKALAALGLDGHMPIPKVTPDGPMEHRLATVAASERRMDAVFEEFARSLPIAKGVATMTTTITGVDGNDIALYITHPIAPGGDPYPAGLNDCASAVRWVYANRANLGISHVITCGESGGGNLALTTVHTAKREGWLTEIAGAYAQCPFLSGR